MLWLVAYFLLDWLLVASLIALLCRGDHPFPRPVEDFFPFRGRWLYYLIVAANALLLLNLGWLFWMFARSVH